MQTTPTFNGLHVRLLGKSLAVRTAALFLERLGVVTDGETNNIVLGEAARVDSFLKDHPQKDTIAILLPLSDTDNGESTPPEEWEAAASTLAGLYEPLLPFASQERFAFPVSSFLAGIYACTALFSALIRRHRTGMGDRVTVPLADAGLVSQGLQATFALHSNPRWSPVQWLASPFKDLWVAGDGRYLYLHVGLPRHLETFLTTLGSLGHTAEANALRSALDPDTRADPISVKTRSEASVVCHLLSALFSKRGALEWEDLFSRAGLCCVAVRSFDEWKMHPQAAPSGLPFPTPLRLWSRENFLSDLFADAGILPPQAAPLTGLRVLDFTQIIAGPLAGRTLAELGAEVIRIENPAARQGFVEPFAAEYHAGKSVRTFDLRRPEDKAALLTFATQWRPHVVLQNFGRGVAERLGISEDDFRKIVPGMVFLDINAFGCEGPLRDLPGFEQTAQALCGFCDDHRKNGIPRQFSLPINDIGAGILGAAGVLAALWYNTQTRQGGRVHTSLAAAATFVQVLKRMQSAGSSPDTVARRGQRLKSLLKIRLTQQHPSVELVSSPEAGLTPVLRAPLRFASSLQISLAPSTAGGTQECAPQRPSARWHLAQFLWGLWLVRRQRWERKNHNHRTSHPS